MWGAAAALGPRRARDLGGLFCVASRRKPPTMATDRSPPPDALCMRMGIGSQYGGVRRLSWPERRGHQADTSSGGDIPSTLIETQAPAMGRRISCSRSGPDASGREQADPLRNRSSRLLPQLRQMNEAILSGGSSGEFSGIFHLFCRIGGRVMGVSSIRSALPTAILAGPSCSPARRERKTTAEPTFQSKPFRPRWNIARRATEYRRKVFVDFFRFRGWRDSNPSTWRINYRPLSSAGVKINTCMSCRMSSARRCERLSPRNSRISIRNLSGGSKRVVAKGKDIYENGDPQTNVPACMACHGPEAKGQQEIPRLAGQLHDYIFAKLVNWSKERGQNPANPDTWPSCSRSPTT